MLNQRLSTIYVSQIKKNDEYVKSIEEALDIVAGLRERGENQPVIIRIADAVYNVVAPIKIKNNVNSVIIEPVDKTLISGGIEIKGFALDVFNGVSCYSKDLSEYGDLSFIDFYVNKKAAKMPTYPQNGTLRAETVENESLESEDGSKWFTITKEDFKEIEKFSNLEDTIISYNHWWIDEHSPIKEIDRNTRKVTMEYKSRFSVSMSSEKTALNYIIENVPEMFGNPNEWYYDKPSKKLYYVPENDDVTAEDIVGFIPVTDKLFVIKGEDEKKVQDINIRNFDIAYTKGDYKSLGGVQENDVDDEGYASDPQAVCNAHGGIEFENAYNCRVENCKLYCFGVHCINIKSGCKNIRITDNDITNIGAGALVIGGGDEKSDESKHTCRNTVLNNRIFHVGKRYLSACGILMKHTYENTISHNEIGYLYYTGISCGWRWGYGENISNHNLIEKNHIHHLGMGRLSDMGGVYILGKQPGTIVRNNLIHDIKSKNYGGWAIYTDEGSSYVLIENNVCYNTSDSPFHQHYGAMNTVRNNIFAFGGKYVVMYTKREEHIGIILENNIIVADGTPVFVLGYSPENENGTLSENEDGYYKEFVSNGNLIFDIAREKEVCVRTADCEYSLEETQKVFGIDVGSIVQDPEFIDAKNFDFTLKPTSPAYKIGFKDIDLTGVGSCRREN